MEMSIKISTLTKVDNLKSIKYVCWLHRLQRLHWLQPVDFLLYVSILAYFVLFVNHKMFPNYPMYPLHFCAQTIPLLCPSRTSLRPHGPSGISFPYLNPLPTSMAFLRSSVALVASGLLLRTAQSHGANTIANAPK